MRWRTSSVSRTIVGLVIEVALSGGRPIRRGVSDCKISVKAVTGKRLRLLTP
jgi:hypothetical protein